MAIKFSGVSEPLQILVDPRHRPFCFKSFPPSSSLCLLEPGSIQQRQSFQICWIHKKGYAFPPFSPICKVLHKVLIDQATLILITPAWEIQSWQPQALDSKPFDFCQSPRFVTRPKEGTSVPNNKRKPATPGMDIFRERLFQKKYQRNLPLLSQMLDDQAQSLFTNRPGISGIADVLGNRLFDSHLRFFNRVLL